MIRAVIVSLGLVFAFNTTASAQDKQPDTQAAIDDAVRRQAMTYELRGKLVAAQEAQKKGDFFGAAKLYEDCLALVKKVGTELEPERRAVMNGFITVRLQLAENAQRRGDFAEADAQVNRILKEDPRNQAALAFKVENEKIRLAEEGRRPSDAAIAKLPEARADQVKVATLVQDGKLFYEAGKYAESEAKLRQALKADPGNTSASYYLDLVMEKNYRGEIVKRESESKTKMLDVARAWSDSVKRESLPVPNPYTYTNIVHTGKGRQTIYSKLDRIRLDTISYDGLPLQEVIKQLSAEAKNRDPDKKGINFIISGNVDPANSGAPAIDPATGLPAQPAGEPTDLGATTIKISPPLTDLTLHQALEVISKVADRPLKYSVEEYAVVFTHRAAETPLLHTRVFKIDPNTFVQGLQGVTAFSFGTSGGGGGSGGGNGGNSGGSSGGRGGGRNSGGGGNNNNNSGGNSGQDSSGSSEYVGVSLTGSSGGGGRRGGQQGRQGQQGNQQGGAAAGAGVKFLTVETPTQELLDVVRQFFSAAGVDLLPPKQIFFNDRSGMLMVRATLQDLDTVEQALQVLNISPPQLTLEAKFAEVTQDDNRALGFDWFIGNTLLDGGRMGVQPGTAPSVIGAPTLANPNGVFPGPSGLISGGAIAPSATDNVLTSGLRNTAPALASYTGILTDPQFRVVIRALEQRQGVDLLSAPKITTLSSRQAQIKVVDIRYIVTDLDLGSGNNGNNTVTPGNNAVIQNGTPFITPISEPIELGPTLDVVPYISADGYTVQMTIIPTIKEFVGYDLDTARLFQAQIQGTGNPLTTTTPLPIFRLRQVVTSAVVWDGQTVVLGGLISENVMKTKDKVPFFGDLPLAGKLFRSESSITKKKNLLIFVTPTIIDPAGNRVHTEEDMPFAQSAIPPQKPVTQ